MKNKLLTILLFLLLLFMTSCSTQEEEQVADLYDENHPFELMGEYAYGVCDCVYLTPLSSHMQYGSCLETEDTFYFDISDKIFIHYSVEEGLIRTYLDVTYVLVPIKEDLDDLFSYYDSDFLDTVTYRFDIYKNQNRTDFSIFENEDHFYIANTRMLGGSKDLFSIWSIYELHEKEAIE